MTGEFRSPGRDTLTHYTDNFFPFRKGWQSGVTHWASFEQASALVCLK